MTKQVWWYIEFEIAEGQVDRVRELTQSLSELAQAEPGSVGYECALTPEGKLRIYERYVDTDAAFAHLGNIGPHLGPLNEVVKPLSGDAYGPLSDAFKEAVAGYPFTFHEVFAGFSK